MTLALPGVDTLPPEHMRLKALSQWFTPPDIARRLVWWAGPVAADRILEPSAGEGAIVRAIREARAAAVIDAVEIDPRFAAELRGIGDPALVVTEGDYLTRPPPMQRYPLSVINTPYEGGVDGLFLEKVMRESDRIIALVRLAALEGGERYRRVWSLVHQGIDGWRMPGLAIFATRPVFDGPQERDEGGKTGFIAVKLSRVDGSRETRVEWW